MMFYVFHEKYRNKNNFINNNNFKYEDYENNIITDKIKRYSGWQISNQQANFINGIIRKKKLKKCLEIGVANGGSSILILNAIKDIENSCLISLDLNEQLYDDPSNKTGYRVNKYFPELNQKWKLFTGDQPHKFLPKLKMKFDFLFLDTRHSAPGEIINFIEALPFLKENAIVVIHDLLWHLYNGKKFKKKFYPSCINLIPAIYGDKVLLGYWNAQVNNIAAIFLYPQQEKHYIDYFLLLLNFWEYIPTDSQINDLRSFIKKFYKKDIYLNIFNKAVYYNKNLVKLL